MPLLFLVLDFVSARPLHATEDYALCVTPDGEAHIFALVAGDGRLDQSRPHFKKWLQSQGGTDETRHDCERGQC